MDSVTSTAPVAPEALTIPGLEDNAFAGLLDGLLPSEPAASGSASGAIGDLAASALDQIAMAAPGGEADISMALTGYIDGVAGQLSDVDLGDPASVDSLMVSLGDTMSAVAGSGAEGTMEGQLVTGIADTALQTLSTAVADPLMAETLIPDALMQFSDSAAAFDDVTAGVTDLPIATDAAFTNLASFTQDVVAGGEAPAGGAIDDFAVADPAGAVDLGGAFDALGAVETGGTVDNSGSLSTTADPADLNASESNQEALEARFIALYERLMEKQVSFKERVEPFKTDNQNAGKG
jgi:hypothetical protein